MVDVNHLYARGLDRRKRMLGATQVENRMAAAGDFGAPLQNIINAYFYGDIWEREGLSDPMRSLVMLAITAASGKAAEFRVHAQGARARTAARPSKCRTCCCWWRCIAASLPRSRRPGSRQKSFRIPRHRAVRTRVDGRGSLGAASTGAYEALVKSACRVGDKCQIAGVMGVVQLSE